MIRTILSVLLPILGTGFTVYSFILIFKLIRELNDPVDFEKEYRKFEKEIFDKYHHKPPMKQIKAVEIDNKKQKGSNSNGKI